MKTFVHYWPWGVVVVASLVLSVFFRNYLNWNTASELATIPAVVALFGALFQLARDNIAFERTIYTEQYKNSFTVGATSHMAIVAFDKHVAFCEEYVVEALAALDLLMRRGPSAEALAHAENLSTLRRKWALWTTPEIENRLDRFEAAIRSIGADAWLADQHIASGDRPEMIKRMYFEFAKVVGINSWRGEAVPTDVAVKVVVEVLQKALAIDALARLRGTLIDRAVDNLNLSERA